MQPVTAYVLAGGKSTRMGMDKAFLQLRGRTLLANAIKLAGAVAGTVKIVGAAEKFSPIGTVVEDIYADHGPLGGIHAALTESGTEVNLIVGVDLPFVQVDFLRYLVSIAESSDAFVTLPCVSGHYEPLCAVYKKDFAVFAERALTAGRNKIDALFSKIPVRTVDGEELAAGNFSPAMFRNVNTPEDWELARGESARGDIV